jgi:hypothetical protein
MQSHFPARTLAIALLGAAGIGPAHAHDMAICNSIADDGDLSDIALGAVSDRKVHFLASDYDRAGCPSPDPGCRQKAYLREKDRVVFDVDAENGGYVCATFVDRRGIETTGWLPRESLRVEATKPRWIGRWKRYDSAEIEITAGAGGKVRVSGSASWGSGAATHEGSIDGTIDPAQPVQGFANDGDSQVPYEAAGRYDCAVRLSQLGRYLFVADNHNCGGANVSFSGVYIRR